MVLRKPINAVLLRTDDGSHVLYQKPYCPHKTVLIDEETDYQLRVMAKEKGTSRHAEMREAIKRHVACFFSSS